jgi:hypothetical protein
LSCCLEMVDYSKQRGSFRRPIRDLLSLTPSGPSALRFDVPNSVLLFGRPLSQLSVNDQCRLRRARIPE